MFGLILLLFYLYLSPKAQAKGFSGPTLGPKESKGEKRDFTEEQLRAGQNVIGLQMGTNKGGIPSGNDGVRSIARGEGSAHVDYWDSVRYHYNRLFLGFVIVALCKPGVREGD